MGLYYMSIRLCDNGWLDGVPGSMTERSRIGQPFFKLSQCRKYFCMSFQGDAFHDIAGKNDTGKR